MKRYGNEKARGDKQETRREESGNKGITRER